MVRDSLEALCIIDAIHSRPLSSWSATRRKRSRGRATVLVKWPSRLTSEEALSSAVRGTRTWSNHSLALSTPLQPILWPMSSTRTPGMTAMLLSRMRTRKPWMPWFSPSTSSCANTTAHLACTAPLVIQYFCASVVGVSMTNSSVARSNVAVVCISTALLPKPSSVNAKQPMSSRLSMPASSMSWWRWVPSFSTVPPNRLNCTVILVAMEGSISVAISCAAKILSGLLRKSVTENRRLSHSNLRRASASSRSSRRSTSYCGTHTALRHSSLAACRMS
mmetsp:Transcript_24220/g.62944  ORF Transcript_24220/g.62944 Transcript_24220/m.62944 type:complete len:277 (+) Transcript_24220:592-1422(+)